MTEAPDAPRTVRAIIDKAGGPAAISEASGGKIKIDAVYKWPQIGIPYKHWPIVMPLAGASADDMLSASLAVRSTEEPAA